MINLKSSRNRKREALRQIALLEKMEKRTILILRREFRRVGREAAAAFPLWEAALPKHLSRVRKILEKELQRTAQMFAQRAVLTVKGAYQRPEMKLDTSQQLTIRIAQWAKRNAAKAVQIERTTRKEIGKVVSESLSDGEHPSETARRIVKEVDGVALDRARTIARTESHSASMTGQHMAIEEAGDELGLELTKTWVATNDDRTRESHLEANGQTVRFSEDFDVGGAALSYPGDPDGPPEEIINCRCGVTYDGK